MMMHMSEMVVTRESSVNVDLQSVSIYLSNLCSCDRWQTTRTKMTKGIIYKLGDVNQGVINALTSVTSTHQARRSLRSANWTLSDCISFTLVPVLDYSRLVGVDREVSVSDSALEIFRPVGHP